MNKTACALAALGLLAGVACRSEDPPTQTQSFEVSDPTSAEMMTFAVSGMR